MIAYLHAETLKRSAGRSIVASSAYISGERETNEYTGRTHDYRAKSGIVHSEVLLPSNTPQSFHSAEKLWSSLECAEKSPQAKLGLSIVAAIPNEIPKEQWIPLAKEFCQHFVDQGCCVQFAIHNPVARNDRGIPINAQGFPAKSPEEYQYLNPHIHCLVCQRMLNENGKWLSRTSCQYIVQDMRTGDVCSMTAKELKAAGEQWQKQYQYNTGTQLQERLSAFQTESSKINSNLMRIRSENADLSAKLENTRRRNDRKQLEQKIQQNNRLLQQGEQLLQRLRVRYGYEDESKLQKNQQLLNQAFRKVRMKEELLHTAKQQVSESKERYLKQKALVPVRIKHLVASYQTRYRQEFTASQLASAIGETMQLVQQVEESILREEEQVEWQQRQQ